MAHKAEQLEKLRNVEKCDFEFQFWWKPINLENHFVWLEKYDFKSRFNIIKYKYVKEIHFCLIFLAKKFVLSMIIRIFAVLVPAEPLYNA